MWKKVIWDQSKPWFKRLCIDLIEKIDGCENNPDNSSTTKVSECIPSGFSLSIVSSFTNIENKHYECRIKDCTKGFVDF